MKMQLNQVIQNAKNGNQVAYKQLFATFSQSMFATSLRITNNPENSKDILQESFITSFQKLATLKDPNSYVFWLRKMVINNSLKSVKKKVELQEIPISLSTQELEETWYQKVPLKEIRDEIQKLPEGARLVFSLFAIEEYKHKEIAAKLDIAESTSKSQYRYACRLLRSKLAKYKEYEI